MEEIKSVNLNEELKKNEERVNKQIIEEEKKFDEEYYGDEPQSDIDELLSKAVEKYLDENEVERNKLLKKYGKTDNTEIKRNKKLRKFFPLIVSASFIVGGITGVELKTFYDKYISPKVVFETDFEKTYDSIEEAPTSVKEAYVEEQYKKYLDRVSEDRSLKDERFEDTVHQFMKAISNTKDETEINDSSVSVSKVAGVDKMVDTEPFEYSEFSRSFTDEEGNVYVPVSKKEEIGDLDILKEQDGKLFKRK